MMIDISITIYPKNLLENYFSSNVAISNVHIANKTELAKKVTEQKHCCYTYKTRQEGDLEQRLQSSRFHLLDKGRQK